MKLDVLGRREDQHLELKSKRALEEPSKIAKGVVGMLNADGGEVWIGVEDRDDIAVAVDPVPGPERAKAQLLDYLVDTVDPSPTPREVFVEVVPRRADPGVLVVKVRPSGEDAGRTPYAFRKGGGWHFLRRVGARNHPMSRQEIFGPAQPPGNDAREEAVQALRKERQAFAKRGGSGLWLGMQPARRLDLDPEDPRFETMVVDPSATENRPLGWHFARSSRRPKLSKDGIEWGFWSEFRGEYVEWTRVSADGRITCRVQTGRLLLNDGDGEISPFKLFEYPVSAFRIGRVIYKGHLGPDDSVVADLAFFGIAGLGLREGTPSDFFFGNDLVRIDEPDLLWEPIVFPFREIDETPDRCGFRLVRRVYHAFGWRESDMPKQYDRDTGRLILPE